MNDEPSIGGNANSLDSGFASNAQTSTLNAGTPDSEIDSATIEPPTITLPKGGGAIRGIGEIFSTSPAPGTGKITVPIPASAGRSDFGPTLSLEYDSGCGNGVFGLGWNPTIPAQRAGTDVGSNPSFDGRRSTAPAQG
jgi:Salmonella virulence plasmid 65kDa B protein